MKKKPILKSALLLLVLVMLVTGCRKNEKVAEHKNRPNNYSPYVRTGDLEEGMEWPEDRVLPKFAKPADTLDTVRISNYSTVERAMLAALQGIVNAKKPRILLIDPAVGEGEKTWPKIAGVDMNIYSKDQKYDIVKKYQDEITGVILYDYKKSSHYMNLASTVAGIKKAIPVTQEVYDNLKEAGIELNVVEDLTTLEYKKAVDIYNYLYEHYWDQCTKRLIVSVSPTTHSYYVRDMAAATQAAVVWLENRKSAEKEVMVKFFKDMKPGESIAIGWYTEERSGIGAGTENGIPTVPADYFENSTVYAGTSSIINYPEVPDKPELENKVYIALFLSDGDNVQYNQHTMKVLWEKKERGSIPLNWTISPSLVDFAPCILNYYYQTASENDFFASGPSGLGYALVVDRLNDKKGEGIVNFTNQEHIDAYTKLTQRYLEKSGLRVITIWDEVKDFHMQSYVKNARYLYGTTYQDWIGDYDKNTVQQTYIVDNKLAFLPNNPCYTVKVDEIYNKWSKVIKEWKQDKPLFFTAQAKSWDIGPTQMKSLVSKLDSLAPGKIEILRGDHFFALFNEYNGLPFNLSLSSKLKVEASDASDKAHLVVNGTSSGEIWSSNSDEKWLKFDLGGEYEISRYVIRHAGDNGQDPSLNTKHYLFETSMDGENWTVADEYVNNTDDVTDIDIDPVKAKYARLVIKDPGADGTARIAEVEIYARVVK